MTAGVVDLDELVAALDRVSADVLVLLGVDIPDGHLSARAGVLAAAIDAGDADTSAMVRRVLGDCLPVAWWTVEPGRSLAPILGPSALHRTTVATILGVTEATVDVYLTRGTLERAPGRRGWVLAGSVWPRAARLES